MNEPDNATSPGSKALGEIALFAIFAMVVGFTLVFGSRPKQQRDYLCTYSFEQKLGIAGPASFTAVENGRLYGTSSSHPESIFEFVPEAGELRVLCTLSTDPRGLIGLNPALLCRNGVLYGTTAGGGARGRGTLFRINEPGTNHTVLHSFGDCPKDGTSPLGLLSSNPKGEIYGTTFLGGFGSGGVLFRIAQDGTDYTLLHHFGQETRDGLNPRSGVIVGPHGRLYGTTVNGGTFRAGVIFTCDASGENYSLMHEFNGLDEEGSRPFGGLVALHDGTLVGTTSMGGIFGMGTIFTFDPEGFNFTTIHHFRTHEGAFPQGELLLGPDSYLYGTAPGGGILGGTLFRLKPDGTDFRVIHTFGAYEGDGLRPIAGLTHYRNRLYGATSEGGLDGLGTVFTALFAASK